ncbi:MAG: AAA family ATPase [Polyangiales bacterium]
MSEPWHGADQVRDLELLVRSQHPLLWIDSPEVERVFSLARLVARRENMPLYTWDAYRGLVIEGSTQPVPGTQQARACLEALRGQGRTLVHLVGFEASLEEPAHRALLRAVHADRLRSGGTLLFSITDTAVPKELQPLFTRFVLRAPEPETYRHYVTSVLRDLATRMPVQVELDARETDRLLALLRGLPLVEVRKLITRAVVEDGKLGPGDLATVLEVKKAAVETAGHLEFYAAEQSMKDVAGLGNLKAWLRKRRPAFEEPTEARRFGLTPPKGLLLIGVQGCGKSLCAKAVSSEWSLPLLRLDPGVLYNKYFGETEKNLKQAIAAAESMAPVVLWIDEIEKAFGTGGDQDSGTSQRVLGSFLTWLNDKQESVFVIATANDISRLPPEFLRKGRFDEIFFVDLPVADVRKQIFGVHLAKRGRPPGAFDLEALATATEGFSGSEIEQAVVAALYTAFSDTGELTTEGLLREIAETRPLSVTMREKVEALRAWARERAVPANG